MKLTIDVIDIESILSVPFPKTNLIKINLSEEISILVDGMTLRAMEKIIKKQDEINWFYDDQEDILILKSITDDSELKIGLNGIEIP